MISISPDTSGRIRVSFPYSSEIVAKIREKKPQHLPTVLTRDETMRVIAATPPEYQLMVKLIYGSGLRLMECLRLRVKDIDFGNNHLCVRDASWRQTTTSGRFKSFSATRTSRQQ